MSIRVTKAQAIALDYNGCGELVRIEAFDSSNPIFFVTGKQFDIEVVQQEVKDESVTVYLAAMLRSVAKIDALLEKAKHDGVWQKKVAS